MARWKPEIRKRYYFFDSSLGKVDYRYWDDNINDNKLYNMGNCFQFKNQAERAWEQVIKLLLSLHGESNDKEKEPKTNKLNYDFPIPIENLTNGKYTDFDCWQMFKEEKLEKERNEKSYQNFGTHYLHPRHVYPVYPYIDFSFVTDIQTNESWLRIELKEYR